MNHDLASMRGVAAARAIARTSRVSPWILALFDEANPGGGDPAPNGGGSAGSGGGSSSGGGSGSGSGSSGSGGGSHGHDPVAAALETQQNRDHVKKLNEENAERRRELKAAGEKTAELEKQLSLQHTRAMRADVRDALRDLKVVDPDVVDLVMKFGRERIKIDPETGEVAGVHEVVADYKKAKPRFFEPDPPTAEELAEKKRKDDEAAAAARGGRKNATSTGTPPPKGGGGANDGTVDGLPNLRDLSPAERKTALNRYFGGKR